MLNWFCVHTKPQQEVRAAIELTNQKFEVFFPILYSKPMFPRYLFTRFDRNIDPWGKIRSTRGCSGLLMDGFMPAIVPEQAIEAIRAYREPMEPVQGQTQFRPGDAVKVSNGPLQGLEGLFVADRKARVACLLELCGRKVEVPRSIVEAA